MLSSIRFEFYNNFDIWYDLYQENGGDPNIFINMMIFGNVNIVKDIDELGFGKGYKYGYETGFAYGYEDYSLIIGHRVGIGNGYDYEYENGFGSKKGYGCLHKLGCISDFDNIYEVYYGNGSY